VRLSELAEQSDTSIPTIKFYLREGLLPPGRASSSRHADYDGSHLERLRLVRALVDVGGLPLAAVRAVLEAMSGPDGVDEAVGIAHGALSPKPSVEAPFQRAEQTTDLLGWHIDRSSTAMGQLESALTALDQVGMSPGQDRIDAYAVAAMALAEFDVAQMPQPLESDPQAAVMSVVLGTVLHEPLLLALRRLAQSDAYGRHRTGAARKPAR
jgi:DNA-binding transcriptional MerR regulator